MGTVDDFGNMAHHRRIAADLHVRIKIRKFNIFEG